MQVGVEQHDGERKDVHSVFRGVPALGAIDLKEATGEGVEDPVEHLGLAGHADVVDEELEGGKHGREGGRCEFWEAVRLSLTEEYGEDIGYKKKIHKS